MTAVEGFGVAVRWVYLVGSSLVVGVFGFLILVARPAVKAAGPDAAAAFDRLDRRLVTLGGWALIAMLFSGLLDLWHQVAVATGASLTGSLEPPGFGAVLIQTRYGTVWLIRQALLLLLGAFLLLRPETSDRDRTDWLVLRLHGIALAGASLAILGAAGHAASAQGVAAIAIAVDAAHLLATGIWFGGLIPLALFLGWALTLPEDPAGSAAAVATRRFSTIGFGSVGLLVLTGSYNAWQQIGSVPALVGTPYGRWLSAKLALLLLLLVPAALNLLVLRPRLARAAGTSPGSACSQWVRQLRRHVVAEVVLGSAILGVVAVLGLTTPGRHVQPTWPFGFRLAFDVTRALPGVTTRLAIGSQVAVFGLVAVLLASIIRPRHWRSVVAGGLGATALGLGVALPPLAVDAYPTTYLSPPVPYTASSVATGLALYREHCAICHGVEGYGDGGRPPPGSRRSRRTSPPLTRATTRRATSSGG